MKTLLESSTRIAEKLLKILSEILYLKKKGVIIISICILIGLDIHYNIWAEEPRSSKSVLCNEIKNETDGSIAQRKKNQDQIEIPSELVSMKLKKRNPALVS